MKHLTTLFAAALACTLSAAPVELLMNRDFSQQSNGKTVGWKINNAGTFTVKSPTASFTYVEHAWGYNMLYTDLNGVQAKVPGQPIRPKGVYHLSFRAKGKGYCYLSCMVQKGKSDNWQFIRVVSSPSFQLTDDFKEYTWDLTVTDAEANLGQFAVILGRGSMEFEAPSMTFDPEKNPEIKDPGFPLPEK